MGWAWACMATFPAIGGHRCASGFMGWRVAGDCGPFHKKTGNLIQGMEAPFDACLSCFFTCD